MQGNAEQVNNNITKQHTSDAPDATQVKAEVHDGNCKQRELSTAQLAVRVCVTPGLPAPNSSCRLLSGAYQKGNLNCNPPDPLLAMEELCGAETSCLHLMWPCNKLYKQVLYGARSEFALTNHKEACNNVYMPHHAAQLYRLFTQHTNQHNRVSHNHNTTAVHHRPGKSNAVMQAWAHHLSSCRRVQ